MHGGQDFTSENETGMTAKDARRMWKFIYKVKVHFIARYMFQCYDVLLQVALAR